MADLPGVVARIAFVLAPAYTSSRVYVATFHRGRECWFEEPDLRIVNRKLRGVHSHSHPAGAGVAVIAGERHLVALVQLAIAP